MITNNGGMCQLQCTRRLSDLMPRAALILFAPRRDQTQPNTAQHARAGEEATEHNRRTP